MGLRPLEATAEPGLETLCSTSISLYLGHIVSRYLRLSFAGQRPTR